MTDDFRGYPTTALRALSTFGELALLPAGAAVLISAPAGDQLCRVCDYPLDFANGGAEEMSDCGLWLRDGSGTEQLVFARLYHERTFQNVDAEVADPAFEAAPRLSHWSDWVADLRSELAQPNGRFRVNCRILGVDPDARDAVTRFIYAGINAQLGYIRYRLAPRAAAA